MLCLRNRHARVVEAASRNERIHLNLLVIKPSYGIATVGGGGEGEVDRKSVV